MLKKEVKEVIKQSLVLIVTAVVIPIPVLLVSRLFGSALSYSEVFFFVFHVGLLVFSVFMGTSLFSRDMGDGGMEYLLTLPYSRLQLLAIKLVPRFLAVLAVFGLYVLLLLVTGFSPNTTDTLPLLATGGVFFLCISLFIIGVPFSITRGSIVISGLATLFALMVYLGIIHLFYPTALLLKGFEIYYIHSLFQPLWNMPDYIWFSAVTLLLGSFLAFIYAFKGFDLGTARRVIKRYLKVFIPVFVIVVVVSLVWAATQLWTPRKFYYLTNSHQLVESDDLSARIYDKTGVKEISEGDFYWGYSPVEKGNYLYTTYNSRYDSKFVRLNLRDPNYSVEVIYTAKGNTSIRRLYTFNNVFAFFERRYRDRQSIFFLVVVQPETGDFREIEVPIYTRVRISMIYPRVFGADEVDGKRFWLVYLGYYKERPIQRVWENGTVEKLATTDIIPFYVNGMLITGDENSIMINKITPEGLEVIKTHPVEKDFSFLPFYRRNLDHFPVKELYGGVKDRSKTYLWKKLLRLDLETFELEEIKPADENRTGFFHYSFPDTWYYTSVDPVSTYTRRIFKKLYRLKQGKPELIKEFEPVIFHWQKDFFGIFNTGMVLKKDGKITVYSLPALEEIEYKKLK
jgi:ABC-type transport system involved in multi-copper enzyme maturation permease subunit